MRKLKQFFQDGTGMYSSYRLVFILWFLSFIIMWVVDSVRNKRLSPMDSTLLTFTTIIIGGKIGQSISENFSPPAPPPL